MIRKKRSLGFSFPDEVAKVTSQKGTFNLKEEAWKDFLLPNFDDTSPLQKSKSIWRIAFFISFILIIFFVLFLKIFHLQIIEGKINRNLADGNRVQIKIIHAPRGAIFDRNGKVLAANSPAFRLIDNLSPGKRKVRIISREQSLELEVNNDPGVKDLEVDNVRSYPLGDMTAHIVGYVNEISEDQLKMDQYKNYRIGDRIGQSGIESYYESILRGKDGGEIVEVDSVGRKIRTLRKEPPIAGQNIYLTIDSGLQEFSFKQVETAVKKSGSCCGAAIVSDPQSGQILSLVSYPSFDPNIFTKFFDEKVIAEIFSRDDFPLLNRAISGTYPPGSTFKIISSIAALSSGKITPKTTFVDNGVIYIDKYSFSNWYFNQYGRTEGAVDILKALQRSNDTYYYEAAKIIGEKPLIDWSRKLYLGKKLGIDLSSEEEGLVPDKDWKQKTFNQIWYPGDTLHLSIGQGFILTTPLQVLGITSFIASGGVFYKPQLVGKIEQNNKVPQFSPKILVKNAVPDDHIQVIKKGLEMAAKDGGTAWPMFTFPVETAGKTGTAEFGDPENRTHAWYSAYAPADDPKIVLTVLIEGGGEGSSVAVPVAKEVFRWFLSEDKNNLIRDLYPQATESGRGLGE